MTSAGDRGTRGVASYGGRGWFFLDPGTCAQCLAGPLWRRAAGAMFGIMFDLLNRVACRWAEGVWKGSLGGPRVQVGEIRAAETLK